MYAECVSHVKAKSKKQKPIFEKQKKGNFITNVSSWQHLKPPLNLSIRKTKALNQKIC